MKFIQLRLWHHRRKASADRTGAKFGRGDTWQGCVFGRGERRTSKNSRGGLHLQLQRGLLNRPLLVLSWPAEELLDIEEEGVDKTLEEEEDRVSIKIS